MEADPAAVNLDAFELFFAERRPFFVEGSGIFRFNMDCNDGNCTGLLYSRRIGRSPQGSADTGDGEYAEAPTAVTILGAAKLTGRIGQFSVGALSAVTQEEQATIAAGLTRRQQTVEPLTSFNVLRARREFANNSNLGVMLTTTNRQSTVRHRLPGRQQRGRRRGLRLAAQPALQRHRVPRRQPHRRQRPTRSRACRRTPSTTSSGPMATT